MSGIQCRRWCVFFLIVAAYLATGEPALTLAETSGYATPVFPPAGIAVGACFALGFETLPAIFVGAFLLNFWIGFAKSFHFGTVELLSGLLLAVASTLQAGLGGWALRKYIGAFSVFDRLRDLARFLAVVPFACLTSSTLSVLSLHLLGTISSADFASSWGAWWLGDLLGVVAVFPLVMVLAGKPRKIWRVRVFTVALPMVAAFAIFVSAFLLTSQWERQQSQEKFRLETRDMAERVRDHFSEVEERLVSLRALMSGGASRERFAGFCEEIGAGNELIRFFEWIPDRGSPFLYPETQNDRLAGLRDALDKAKAGGRLYAISTPDPRLQILLLPARGGVVAAGVRVPVETGRTIYARLVDVSSGEILFDSFPKGVKPSIRNRIEFGQKVFSFESAPTKHYLNTHRAWTSWAVLVAGIIFTGILGAFLLLGTGYTARIAREVGERTEALRKSEFRYQQMFETNAAVKLLIDPKDGSIVDANAAAERFYGYSHEALLAMKIYEINIMEEGETRQNMQDARTGENPSFHFRHRLHSGEIRDVEVYSGPVDLEGGTLLYSIVHDITDRKKTEETLRLYTSVFESSSEAVMVVDRDGKIVEVNPAFTLITGYSAEEAKGGNPAMLQSGRQDAAFYRDMWRELEEFGHWQGEIWNRRKNGEIYPEWLTINTICDADGNLRERVAIFSDISKKKEAETEVWRQANFDALTGLPNRNMFRDRLDFEIRKAARSGLTFALLFIDLDRFKEVNDTLGHEAGDRLLLEAASRIASAVRESDTVARLGGDEFTVILSDLREDAHVENAASAIIARLAEPFVLGEELAYISGSIGITLYPSDASNSAELVKNADQAMYVAKGLGKNRFAYFTPALQEAALERMKLIAELRNAIANGEFRLLYQPIVDLVTGKIVKAEALLRWGNPRRGEVSPGEFIPLAEETGLIHEIGDWVFREAALRAREWRQTCESFQVSVNSSPLQLMYQTSENAWISYLEEIGLEGGAIVVEITEGVLLHADSAVIERLGEFRKAGIQIAIDDLGTGYSALAYLRKFEIDYLKIDRSFVSGIESSPDGQSLSRAITAMAHSLGIEVVAEGVETRGQERILFDIECDYVQGYLFSRPVEAEEFGKMLCGLDGAK